MRIAYQPQICDTSSLSLGLRICDLCPYKRAIKMIRPAKIIVLLFLFVFVCKISRHITTVADERDVATSLI